MTEIEKQKDIYILGIESSCDETAASVDKKRQRGTFQRDLLSDCLTYVVRRRGAGDRIPEAYREDQPGH